MRKDYLFVAIQFILFFAFGIEVISVRIELWEVVYQFGFVMCISGLLIILIALIQLNKNLSPFPTPVHGSDLITNGIFAHMRHPIYSGILLGGLGYAIYNESLWKAIILILLYVLFEFKSRYEEKLLLIRFENYSDYMKKTRRFIPRILSNR